MEQSNTESSIQNKSFSPLLIVGVVIALILVVGVIIWNSKKPLSTPSTSTVVLTEPTQGPIVTDFTKNITLEEIAAHSEKTDCWMAIEGSVYDVSEFVPKHPGEDAILLGCGKDATEMFNSRPNDGTSHSSRARTQLSKYLIGALSK